MAKRSILILDCTTENEPSEGRLLKEFFQMCRLHKPVKASSLYYKIKSKTDFLSKLNTGKRYDIIHISAHGSWGNKVGIGNGSTWVATPEDIGGTNHRAKLVFANACLASKKKIVDAFWGADYVVAPNTEVSWIDASLFSLMFYRRYIVDGYEMKNAFQFARRRTQTSTDYPAYWKWSP